MRFYKNSSNELFLFEVDGSQDHLITEEMQEISIHEFNRIKTKETVKEPTWEDVKKIRNGLLAESDWTDLPNSPINNKPAWLRYRQALRDITKNFSKPTEINWPVKPQ